MPSGVGIGLVPPTSAFVYVSRIAVFTFSSHGSMLQCKSVFDLNRNIVLRNDFAECSAAIAAVGNFYRDLGVFTSGHGSAEGALLC